jgi:hypothetical protein
MFENNARMGAQAKYTQIYSYLDKGKLVHIAWFEEDLKNLEELQDDTTDS